MQPHKEPGKCEQFSKNIWLKEDQLQDDPDVGTIKLSIYKGNTFL